jgi:membrane-bound lytic murein transglycosylase F
MQLLPSPAAERGTSDAMNPSSNIRAGVKYLKSLFDMFPGETENDRLSFALAAYNMGPRPVMGARGVAAAKGMNPLRWKDIADVLCDLKKGKYGRKKSWSCNRGERAVNYVMKIMAYYELLKFREIKPPPVCIYDSHHEDKG